MKLRITILKYHYKSCYYLYKYYQKWLIPLPGIAIILLVMALASPNDQLPFSARCSICMGNSMISSDI